MTPELEKFCELLETTDIRQIYGDFVEIPHGEETPCAACAIGVLLIDYKRTASIKLHWGHSGDLKTDIYDEGGKCRENEAFEAYGLDRHLAAQIIRWNDREKLSFHAIAARIREAVA